MAQELKGYEEVRQHLSKMEDFKSALPSHIQPEKFIQVVVTAVQNNADLLKLDRQSLYLSCIKCAQDGLLPDGQEAALVPRKGKVAYTPMIEGVLKRIRNSGMIKTVDAQEVYENDTYESWTDEHGPHFKHVKARKDRGKPWLTYAYAITNDGGLYFEEMDEDQMAAVEKCASTKEVWNGAFRSEMKRKSVLHRLSKRLPKNTDIERIIHRDDEDYVLPGAAEQAAPAKETSSKLNAAVEEADFRPASEKAAPATSTAAPVAEKKSTEAVGCHLKQGLIENLTVKDITKDGKPSRKYGCKIQDKWYATFEKDLYLKMEDFANKKVLVNLSYNERMGKNDKKEDQLYFDAISVNAVTVDDLKNQGDTPTTVGTGIPL